jgi:PTH1 family peptidyl-tRNA hydrolase
MQIIIGLGNPGKKYQDTRHNLGFMFLNFIKKIENFPQFSKNQKLEANISKKDGCLLVKPETFINLSGKTVEHIINFYKISLNDILVIHDDLDIEMGQYKIVSNSSSAGHNGIKDIIEKLGTQEFKRIRIGIKNEQLRNPIDPADFVLQKLTETEKEIIKKLFPEIKKEIEKIT